ncbi:hypothetical protein GOV14_01545 [Candidatus Pacearchaeota archaeon]|nr:hypothetical protein [Candidatus Pacearchaeota archaeon]
MEKRNLIIIISIVLAIILIGVVAFFSVYEILNSGTNETDIDNTGLSDPDKPAVGRVNSDVKNVGDLDNKEETNQTPTIDNSGGSSSGSSSGARSSGRNSADTTPNCVGESCDIKEDFWFGCDESYVCREGGCVVNTTFPIDYVSYWKFDGNADDEAKTNNGTLIDNAIIATDTERGQVVDLDGDGDYVRVTDNDSLDVSEITVLTWVYLKDETYDTIIEKGSRSAQGWGFSWNANPTYKGLRIDARLGGNWDVNLRTSVPDLRNGWHQVGWKLESPDQLSFIVDSEIVNTQPTSGLLAPTNYDLCIGAACNNYYSLNGAIDDVMIFNRSLSEQEIQKVYDVQSGLVIPAIQDTYYVSITGDDNNNGSMEYPFATIQKARETIRRTCANGVTVYIREGTYYLNETLEFDSRDSGVAGHPNKYVAYQNEEVVIKGSKKIPISEFTTYSGNILQANLSDYDITEFYQMFMNSKRLIPARYPNYDPADPVEGGWLFSAANTTKGILKYNAGDFDTIGWNISNAWVDIFTNPNYGNYIFKVNSIDEDNKSISISSGNWAIDEGNRYYFANIFQELDSENEWYFDKDSKMLYLYPENSLSAGDEITVPVAINTISLNGVDYLEFKGIDVQESWAKSSAPLYYNDRGNCFNIFDSEFITIDDSKISNSGLRGIYIADSMNITIKNSEISNTGREAIHALDNIDHFKQLINTGYVVTNNTIHDTNEIEIIWSGAIRSRTVGSVYSYNHFYDLPRLSILLYGSNDNIAEYNHVHDVNTKTQDTASLYFIPYTSLNRGNVFRYNFVNESGGLCQYSGQLYPNCYSFGIYLDNAASGTLVYGNTILNSASSNIYVNGGRDNIIENNLIIGNPKTAQIGFGGPWGNASRWAQAVAGMDANGYNSALYYQKYPELLTIRADLTDDEVTGYNRISNNRFIYPSADTELYKAYQFDLNTNQFNNNVIWQGLRSVSLGVKRLTWTQWQENGFDVNSQYVNDVFENTVSNNGFDDDYIFLINTEHGDKEFVLENDLCDLEGNIVSDSITLKSFESKILLSCFCNNDIACNNRETTETCPADCTEICTDNIQNQDETSIDCGGVVCDGCVDGELCLVNLDCSSNYCNGGICEVAIFPTDYVGYWKFDGDLNDESLNNNNGVLEGNVSLIDDVERGQVVDFDDVGSVRVANSASLGVNEITVLAWVYLREETYDAIIEKGARSAQGWSFFWSASPTYKFLRIDGRFGGNWVENVNIRTSVPDLTNEWHQVGWKLESPDQLSFIVDGEIVSTKTTTGLLTPTIYDLCIGAACNNYNPLNGSIDDVMIYDRPLSETEIQQIYCGQGGSAGFCSSIGGSVASASLKSTFFSRVFNWFKSIFVMSGQVTGNSVIINGTRI